jgi:hypothetical protein
VAECERVVADGGYESRQARDAVALSVDDEDHAEMWLGDRLVWVQADGSADATECTLVRAVCSLGVCAEGVAGIDVDELTKDELYTRETEDREAADSG